jgi:spore maturation protein CgeB
MRCVIFTHSLVSDWNHGNAHFLRGIATELISRGHDVEIYEPFDSWSRSNLLLDQGQRAIQDFEEAYPHLRSKFYSPGTIDIGRVLDGAGLVIVHEWNPHSLVRKIGVHHLYYGRYFLFFHDTHHRILTDPAAMAAYDLRGYDGVLAYGDVIRDSYMTRNFAKRAWTWHEAADTRVFQPVRNAEKEGDVVWIGNWGDDERTQELHTYLIEPVKALQLRARVYGVRYPEKALHALRDAGIEYGGWIPNHRVPEVFSKYHLTVHVPRRPYATALPGIPTIRPFEALACGIPMISAPWNDCEGLFRPGSDFLYAKSSLEMMSAMSAVLSDRALAERLAANGLFTIRERHTCAHRVNELLAITEQLSETEAVRRVGVR